MHPPSLSTLALLISMASACLAEEREFPSIEIHAATYQSACAPSEWKTIQERLQHLSRDQKPMGLVSLVRAWLCGSGAADNRLIRRSAPNTLTLVAEATGDPQKAVRQVSRSSLLVREGRAWGAIVHGEDGMVLVSYYPSEVCVTGAKFALRNGRWMFASLSEGCD